LAKHLHKIDVNAFRTPVDISNKPKRPELVIGFELCVPTVHTKHALICADFAVRVTVRRHEPPPTITARGEQLSTTFTVGSVGIIINVDNPTMLAVHRIELGKINLHILLTTIPAQIEPVIAHTLSRKRYIEHRLLCKSNHVLPMSPRGNSRVKDIDMIWKHSDDMVLVQTPQRTITLFLWGASVIDVTPHTPVHAGIVPAMVTGIYDMQLPISTFPLGRHTLVTGIFPAQFAFVRVRPLPATVTDADLTAIPHNCYKRRVLLSTMSTWIHLSDFLPFGGCAHLEF
jgi:hypothetical protein